MKEAKRRYSEFESLRKSLVKLYPILLIPPIPEKHTLCNDNILLLYNKLKRHTIAEYARKDENASMIDKRKRMLERFLNRICSHPILRQEHVFHRFILGSENWVNK